MKRMKKTLAVLLAVTALFLTVSLCSCSSKDENLDIFEFLLSRPTVGEVNDKIGKYNNFNSEYLQKTTAGSFYKKTYEYDLSVCGISGKLTGQNVTVGESGSDSLKPDSWYWFEDVPADKLETFKTNVTEYFNNRLGAYSDGQKNGYSACVWSGGGEYNLYFIVFDSDTVGLIID